MPATSRTFRPVRVVEMELTEAVADLTGLEGYRAARVLVRLHGYPIGTVVVPIRAGGCAGVEIRNHALRQLGDRVIERSLAQALEAGFAVSHAPDLFEPSRPHSAATVTIAVCTRDRAASLETCLTALDRLDPPPAEILVVDNASRDTATRTVAGAHPRTRYLLEPRPGLDWARNRAIAEAQTPIIAFTDDDVVVDSQWAGAIASAFDDNPAMMALTGLVEPLELETEAQELFERYGGFGRGFARHWYRVNVAAGEDAAKLHGGTGKFGTGANMAFRRALFSEIGGFDPALDVGTMTNGGGDLDMFYRVLQAGHTLGYDPAALVWHRHRRTYPELRTQLANNGVGFYSHLVRNAIHDPAGRRAFVHLAIWWFGYWSLRRLLLSYLKPGKFPRDLVVAELGGSIRGIARYPRARRSAALLATKADAPLAPRTSMRLPGNASPSRRQRAEFIGRALEGELLSASLSRETDRVRNRALRAFRRRFQIERPSRVRLTDGVSVSIVVPTFDRPGDLRRCLSALASQRSRRALDIIVVDNHPTSGLTPAVVASFPDVRLISEPRQGLSFARNAGIRAAKGDLLVATDDDVTMPTEWLETLVAPFVDPETMIVTGNVIAADLSGKAQQLFEAYGGLSRGTEPQRVDGNWFWAFRGAVPTWRLGATANAAFRRTIFFDPQIGVLDEALGAGTPAGCSEDTYLFYKALRAGYTIQYEPRAVVWHHHRSDMRALRHQIYSYAKGHVAYQLTTLLRDRDLRAVERLFVELPRLYASRLRDRWRGESSYPASLIALEVLGNLVGPFALWRSRRRASRLRKHEIIAGLVSNEDSMFQERAS